MHDLNSLFQQFLRERRYLQNITPKTIAWYEAAWLAFSRAYGEGPTTTVDPPGLSSSSLWRYGIVGWLP